MGYRDNGVMGPGFAVSVVKLIDGYIGQVTFEYEIVHQTELQETGEAANDAAREAMTNAVKRLFQ